MIANYIAKFLECALLGNTDREIRGLASIASACIGDLTFATESYLDRINGLKGCIVIMPYFKYPLNDKDNTLLQVENPRLAFARASRLFISLNPSLLEDYTMADATATIHPSTVIEGRVVIGRNVNIQALCTIGTEGFGFERDEKDEWVFMPQIGKVVIEDNVEIAAHTNVHRGTLDDTIIGEGSKISINCNIGHNVVIGKHTFVAGKSNFGGKTKIGHHCFIGMGTITKPGIIIGDNTVIGMGSIITKNIPDNVVAFGNPAKVVSDNL